MLAWKLAAALFAASVLLCAQTSTGEIDNAVQDASGVIIPKAGIIITGSETGSLTRSISPFALLRAAREQVAA